MPPARPAASKRPRPAGPSWDQVELAPVVLVRGGEELLGERAVDRLLAQARAKDPTTEVVRLDAATYEPHMLDTLVSPSLFGEPRLVHVPNLEQMTDALLADLLAYVAAPDPDVVVILRHNSGQCEPIKKDGDKAALVNADARRAGRRIEPGAIGALVDALGSDLRELTSAVAQLMADTEGTITVAHVNTYYAGRIEATGFSVADAAISGNVARAVTLLRHALATGVAPVLIVSALAVKLRQLARVAAAGGRPGMGPKELGMSPWQAKRARAELSGWSDDALAAAIIAVARADAETKGASRDPEHAVERAVLAICSARRGRLATRH